MSVIVPADRLRAFAAGLLAACGVPEADAATAAAILVEADLRGVHSHGVLGLLVYTKRLRAGGIAPRASISVAADRGAALLVDGGNGLGQVVGAAAMGRAIARARETSVALVGVRNSNHLGMNGAYAMMALPHDMIGFVTNAGSGNLLAPWGGVEALLGTNPIALAVPAGEEPPPVLDMAMSQVSKGKITLAAARGEASIPAGWAMNRRGETTTDTREAMEGLLVPIGGYKGAGLSFMTGLLAGVWVGGLFGRQVRDLFSDPAIPQRTGHLMAAARVDAFMDPTEFKRRVDAAIREIRASARAAGAEAVLAPGERGHRLAAQRRAAGIPLDAEVARKLQAVANEVKLSQPRLVAV
jgi:LDH2 family malate/lactate/ureidoglycolate dehydrogenase